MTPKPTYLKLLPLPDAPAMTAEQMYGRIFCAYAEIVSDVKKAARDLMIDALNKGLDPLEFDADFSLVDLDLAEIRTTYGGDIEMVYIEPQDEVAIITGDE